MWRHDAPSYDRTWAEIEAVLEQAITEMKAQRTKYMLRKMTGPKEAKYRKRSTGESGIVDTLMDHWGSWSSITAG